MKDEEIVKKIKELQAGQDAAVEEYKEHNKRLQELSADLHRFDGAIYALQQLQVEALEKSQKKINEVINKKRKNEDDKTGTAGNS